MGDYLPGAGAAPERISNNGDLAMPAASATISVNSVDFYGNGVVTEASAPGTVGGVAVSGNQDLLPLRADLQTFAATLADLTPECTISPLTFGYASATSPIGNSPYMLELNMDACDTNNDGIAVYEVQSGSEFVIENFNMIFESAGLKTFGVFLIKADRMRVSSATLMGGDGVVGNVRNDCPSKTVFPPPPPGTAAQSGTLTAMFVHLGESHLPSHSGNKNAANTGNLFDISNSVIEGIGFFDMTAFDTYAGGAYNQFKTGIRANNVEGCTQMIAPRLDFDNVRFDKCIIPCGPLYPNSADALCEGHAPVMKKCSVFGDPYIKRWGETPDSSRKAIAWQGGCDVIVTKTQTAYGHPLMIQARTSVSPVAPYSVVSEVAIEHGTGTRVRFTANNEVFYGPANGETKWTPSGTGDSLKVGTHDWLTVKYLAPVAVGVNTYKDLQGQRVPDTTMAYSYEIALSGFSTVTISNVVDFMNIVIHGSETDFFNGGGVCGEFQLGKPMLRDGSRAADYQSFAENWVPTPAESLFANHQGICTYPAGVTSRRLRGKTVDPEFEAQAREACEGADELELCMDDVIVTNNLGAAWIHKLV
jgi:hypothetical protein